MPDHGTCRDAIGEVVDRSGNRHEIEQQDGNIPRIPWLGGIPERADALNGRCVSVVRNKDSTLRVPLQSRPMGGLINQMKSPAMQRGEVKSEK